MMTIKAFEKATGIRLCTDHTGKMEGMYSLSTSVMENQFCKARYSGGKCAICKDCFAKDQFGRHKNMNPKYTMNTRLLCSTLLEEFPIIPHFCFRFESFGDLNNTLQARNYLRIAKASPHCTFTLWTKNPNFLKQAIEIEGKPDNFIAVLSSLKKNERDIPMFEKFRPYFDYLFTVWDSEEIAKENGVTINCGSRQCITCQRCYKKGNDPFVDELLK